MVHIQRFFQNFGQWIFRYHSVMRNRIIIKVSILIICIGLSLMDSMAQNQNLNMGSIDFASIKVDDLSDDQISLLMEKAGENGIAPQQIEMAALAKGMPQAEVQKLRLRMNTLGTIGTRRSNDGLKETDRLRKQTTTQKKQDLDADNILTSMLSAAKDSMLYVTDPRTRVFGYSLFNTKDLTFEPSVNIPTPANYVLGPGDEVIIDIWGASQKYYKLEVTPDGFIVVDNVGPILVSGIQVEEASKKILARLSSIYAGIRGPHPNTFAQISLGNLRSIHVVVLGEVYLPGSYTLSSLAKAFNALYLSGGPNINGSLRNISIIRDNMVIDTLDVYDFLFKGEIKKNILLNDQDIVKIDPYSIRVKVSGEVKRPLIYEMKAYESLSDLIRFTGGFADNAYQNRIKIIRNTSREKEILDVPVELYATTILQNGDSIIVEPIIDRFTNRVELRGAVYRPGEYSINDSLTLLQLIKKAEGIKGDAFLNRTIIYRTREDYTLETIPVDLSALLKGTVSDILLKREDIVNIPSIFDLQEEYYIQIDGEVKNPGKFPFMYNSTVEDIIIQAGGLLESASMAQLEVARRVKNSEATTSTNIVADILYYQISKDLRLSDAGKRLVLEPFDRIFIRRSPGYEEQITAKIEGEVLYPGEYSISTKNERISDLIKRSGGLTVEAYPNGASLIRQFPVDEKERTKALQSSRLFRENIYRSNQIGSLDNVSMNNGAKMLANDESESGILDEKKMQQLDSIIISATQLTNLQTIGIDLEKILKQPLSKYDLILHEGDRLIVPKLLQTVSLKGELLHPISSRYDMSFGFKDYIRSAGGFTATANRSKSYVIYANGTVDATRSFLGIKNYPKPGPGAEIVVPFKNRRIMSPGEIVSLGSALTSMALIVVTLLNNMK